MRLRSVLPFVLAFVLLFAQQAGFVHAHAAAPLGNGHGFRVAAQGTAPAPLPGKSRHEAQLCALCVLATVGHGALPSGSHLPVLAAASAVPHDAPAPRFVRHTASPFLSRAPPALA